MQIPKLRPLLQKLTKGSISLFDILVNIFYPTRYLIWLFAGFLAALSNYWIILIVLGLIAVALGGRPGH